MAETFRFRRRVEFAETDMAGIVHFSNFLRMMEAAEHEFLRSLGSSVHVSTAEGTTGWPRLKVGCEYFRPLRFEDWVEIEVKVVEVRTRSVRYAFEFWRDAVGQGERVARGEVVAVHTRVHPVEGLKAESIPARLREALLARVEVLPQVQGQGD